MNRTVEVFDAVGLGAFCATATTRAAAAGLPPMTAVLLGTITGIGGGILRNVMAGITPAVLRPDARLYAIPAVTGCTLVAMAQEAGIGGPQRRSPPPPASAESDSWPSGADGGRRSPAPTRETKPQQSSDRDPGATGLVNGPSLGSPPSKRTHPPGHQVSTPYRAAPAIAARRQRNSAKVTADEHSPRPGSSIRAGFRRGVGLPLPPGL